MPRVTCIFRIRTSLYACVYTKKVHVTSGISTVFHEKALHIINLAHAVKNKTQSFVPHMENEEGILYQFLVHFPGL